MLRSARRKSLLILSVWIVEPYQRIHPQFVHTLIVAKVILTSVSALDDALYRIWFVTNHHIEVVLFIDIGWKLVACAEDRVSSGNEYSLQIFLIMGCINPMATWGTA